MSGYVLLSGATGLLGQYLVRDLLLAGHRLALLVRGNENTTAAERVEAIMQLWEQRLETPLPRPVCIAGDITQPGLGISEADNQWINDHCSRMIHSAASLVFREETSTGEPYRTNVQGTENVIHWLEQSSVRDLHYISTAYVCGRRDDLVMENELDVGQKFRNDYEKSKFAAEKMVREASFLDQLTVYRPVVITGDSETGYTSTYHGSYLYMKLAATLANNIDPDENGNRHLPIRWGLTGDERRNITPVEWNSRVITRLFDTPEAHGETFHMPPSVPITMREVIEMGTKYFNITGVDFAGYGFQEPDPPLTELERWVWASIQIYGAYDFMDPKFDQSNLLRFVPDLPCPKIDTEVTERILAYALEDRWGRRRPSKLAKSSFTMEDKLPPIAPCSEEGFESGNGVADFAQIGLDVLGPGGGQWTIGLDESRIVSARRGLNEQGQTVLQLSMQELAAIDENCGVVESLIRERLSNQSSVDEDLARRLATALCNGAVETTS